MMWDEPAMVKTGVELIEKFVPDTDAKNRAIEAWNLKVLEISAQEASQQSETNKAEAQSASFCLWLAAGRRMGLRSRFRLDGHRAANFFVCLHTHHKTTRASHRPSKRNAHVDPAWDAWTRRLSHHRKIRGVAAK